MKTANDFDDFEGPSRGNAPNFRRAGQKERKNTPGWPGRGAWAGWGYGIGGGSWGPGRAGSVFGGPGRHMTGSHTETVRNGPISRFSRVPGVVGAPGGKTP